MTDAISPETVLLKFNLLNENLFHRLYGASEIVLSEAGDDFALIKVAGIIDTSVHTPVCLPNQGN